MTKDEFEHIDYSQLQIKIACTGSDSLPLDAIEEFQGNLKKHSKKDIDKIIRSIVEYGFSFPFFIWNGTGHNLCLDGHGRILALAEMRKRGTDLPVFPVVYVEANDEQEAKQKLLRLNSQYGQMTLDSVMEFADGMELNSEEINLSDGGSLEFNSDKKSEDDSNSESNEIEYHQKLEIIVSCKDEEEQQDVYNMLIEEGIKCQLSTL